MNKQVDPVKLHHVTNHEINYLKSKVKIHEKELYYLIRNFFKELLQLDYEFTHEELVEELGKTYMNQKIHDEFVRIIRTIGQIEYSEKDFNQEELRNLLQDLEKNIDKLFHEDQQYSIMDKILINFHLKQDEEKETAKKELSGIDKKLGLETPEYEKIEEEISILKNNISKIGEVEKEIEEEKLAGENPNTLTEHVKELVKVVEEELNDIESLALQDNSAAKKQYKKALSKYNALPEYEKKQEYESLMKAYNAIKHSESEQEEEKAANKELKHLEFSEEAKNIREMTDLIKAKKAYKTLLDRYNKMTESEKEKHYDELHAAYEYIEANQVNEYEFRIKRIREIADKDISKAKEQYKHALDEYNELPKEEQKKHYNQLMETYKIVAQQ